MKTLQQIADIIAKHLFNQKEACVDDFRGRCQYRLEKMGVVNKCAFGALIPDELYIEAIEGKGSDILFKEFPEFIATCGIPNDGDTHAFLNTAQIIHDSDWTSRDVMFKELCKEYNLEYNPQ